MMESKYNPDIKYVAIIKGTDKISLKEYSWTSSAKTYDELISTIKSKLDAVKDSNVRSYIAYIGKVDSVKNFQQMAWITNDIVINFEVVQPKTDIEI